MKRVIILKSENPYNWYKDKVSDVIEIDSIDDRGYGILKKNGVLDKVINPKEFAEVVKVKLNDRLGIWDAHILPFNPDYYGVHDKLELGKSRFWSKHKSTVEVLKSGGLSFEADFSKMSEKMDKFWLTVLSDAYKSMIHIGERADKSALSAFNIARDAGRSAWLAEKAAKDLINEAKESLKTKRTVFAIPNPLIKKYYPGNPFFNERCNPEKRYSELNEALKKLSANDILNGYPFANTDHLKVGPIDASQIYKVGVDVAKSGSDKTVIGVFASGPDKGKPIYKGEIKIDGITVSEGEKVGVKNHVTHQITETFDRLFKLSADESDYVYLKSVIKESPDLFYHLVKKFIKSKGIAKMEADLHNAAVTEINRVSKMPIFNTDLFDEKLKKSVDEIELTYRGYFKQRKVYQKNDFVCFKGAYYRCKHDNCRLYLNPNLNNEAFEPLEGKTYKVKF